MAPGAVLGETAVTLQVAPPATAPAGGWVAYQVEPCPASPAGAQCLRKQSFLVEAAAASTTCAVSGLEPATAYQLKVTAVVTAGGKVAVTSEPAALALTTRAAVPVTYG